MFANDSTRDIGDVGLAFTQQAIDAGLVQGYKTSYWDSVPDWAKAEDGLWMIAYTGCTSFIFNNDLAGGQKSLQGRIFRIAHLGVIEPYQILGALACLEITLRAHGHGGFEPGAGVAAAQAYFEGHQG